MSVATQGTASNYLQRAPSPSGLADVVDLILDKGLVIDAFVRVAVIGIELVTIDARIVIAQRRHVPAFRRSGEPSRPDADRDRGPQRAARRGVARARTRAEGMAKGAKEAFSGNGKGD